jgi:co-chaperonin GroES (HSP10)
MKDQFEPIGDKLICLPVDQEEMSSGGIYLPDVDDKKIT